jgi:CheY-like chemotaxis protein
LQGTSLSGISLLFCDRCSTQSKKTTTGNRERPFYQQCSENTIPLAAGMDEYITKPVDATELVDVLQRLLGHRT